MTLPVTFKREAERDVAEAADWYESQAEGLGAAFLRAVDVTVNRIRDNPRGYQLKHRDARRAGLHRFPYGLYFVIRERDIVIVACHHAKRDPAIWQTRV